MLILLVCGLYSGERIFFAGFIALCCVLLASLLSLAYAGFRFKYMQAMQPVQGVKGDTLQYSLQVHNDGLAPMPYLGVTYDTVDSLLCGTPAHTALSLLPRTHNACTESLFCRYRGRWSVGLKKVEIRDFFDLFSVTLNAEKILSHKPLVLLVRPRVLSLEHLPMRRHHDEGPMETAPRDTDDTALLSDARKYRTGDSIRRIHWKLTARQREVMVKNYEENSMPDMLVYVDVRPSELEFAAKISLEDTLVECATAVAHYLLGHFLPTSLIYYSDRRVQLRGAKPEHFQTFYAVFSEMLFNGAFLMEDVLKDDLQLITQSGNLLLVTSALSARLFDLLMLMNSSGINITVILVYEPEQETSENAIANDTRHKASEMRNAGITVIDLQPGENLAQRVEVLT